MYSDTHTHTKKNGSQEQICQTDVGQDSLSPHGDELVHGDGAGALTPGAVKEGALPVQRAATGLWTDGTEGERLWGRFPGGHFCQPPRKTGSQHKRIGDGRATTHGACRSWRVYPKFCLPVRPAGPAMAHDIGRRHGDLQGHTHAMLMAQLLSHG